MNTTWNPELYLKFQRERIQPSIDLVSRIALDSPATAIDIGCGPGNSTQVIADRWPSCTITGVDSSDEMISKARADFPQRQWLQVDVRDLPSHPSYDLVYSNAVLQWIPDHERLVPHLFGMVREAGALAVQVPLFDGMPARGAIDAVANRSRWSELMSGITPLVFHDAGFYYDILSEMTREIVMWQTLYIHEMESHASIVEMMKSTALRPHLSRIETESQQKQFLQQVAEEVASVYPVQRNLRVLFPFHRLFFIAYPEI
jgi:trans-aconitate 2-methyltransferase